MSAELSRRLARVAHQPPIVRLPGHERWALGIAVERATDFAELTQRYQQLILQAEASREQAIAERRLSVPR